MQNVNKRKLLQFDKKSVDGITESELMYLIIHTYRNQGYEWKVIFVLNINPSQSDPLNPFTTTRWQIHIFRDWLSCCYGHFEDREFDHPNIYSIRRYHQILASIVPCELRNGVPCDTRDREEHCRHLSPDNFSRLNTISVADYDLASAPAVRNLHRRVYFVRRRFPEHRFIG